MFQLLDMIFNFPEVKFPNVPKCANGTCDGKLTSVTEFHCIEGKCESKVHLWVSSLRFCLRFAVLFSRPFLLRLVQCIRTQPTIFWHFTLALACLCPFSKGKPLLRL